MVDVNNINELKNIKGPFHYFFVFDDTVEYCKAFQESCSNKPNALLFLPDELLRYFNDYLCWIPTFFYRNKSVIQSKGFDFEGWSMIDCHGRKDAIKIFKSLKNLFDCAPDIIVLKGNYDISQKEYIKIKIKKSTIIAILNHFIAIFTNLKKGNYFLHLGV